MNRLWAKKEKHEQTGSRDGTVEEVWRKREAGGGLMANDKGWVPGSAGRAWAGHSAGRGRNEGAQEPSREMEQPGLQAGSGRQT